MSQVFPTIEVIPVGNGVYQAIEHQVKGMLSKRATPSLLRKGDEQDFLCSHGKRSFTIDSCCSIEYKEKVCPSSLTLYNHSTS